LGQPTPSHNADEKYTSHEKAIGEGEVVLARKKIDCSAEGGNRKVERRKQKRKTQAQIGEWIEAIPALGRDDLEKRKSCSLQPSEKESNLSRVLSTLTLAV
jgi:hypothetical protein